MNEVHEREEKERTSEGLAFVALQGADEMPANI